MKITIIKKKCIGCGKCYKIAPFFYDFDDEGIAIVKKMPPYILTEDEKEVVNKSIRSCPTQAIQTK